MKHDIQSIKAAADLLDRQAAKIASLSAKIASQASELKVAEAKVASASPSAELVKIAQETGDLLLSKGLLTTPAKRDEFVAKIAQSPFEALTSLKKVAGIVHEAGVKKIGHADGDVIVPVTNEADAKWSNAHAAFKARI